MLLLTWLRHVGGNLADSTRYAANPVWMHRNVRAVASAAYLVDVHGERQLAGQVATRYRPDLISRSPGGCSSPGGLRAT